MRKTLALLVLATVGLSAGGGGDNTNTNATRGYPRNTNEPRSDIANGRWGSSSAVVHEMSG